MKVEQFQRVQDRASRPIGSVLCGSVHIVGMFSFIHNHYNHHQNHGVPGCELNGYSCLRGPFPAL